MKNVGDIVFMTYDYSKDRIFFYMMLGTSEDKKTIRCLGYDLVSKLISIREVSVDSIVNSAKINIRAEREDEEPG